MVIDLLVRLQILRLRDSRNSHQNQIIGDALRQKILSSSLRSQKNWLKSPCFVLITEVEVTQDLLHFFTQMIIQDDDDRHPFHPGEK